MPPFGVFFLVCSLQFSIAIASGMEFIEDIRLVHRDLATRNVVLVDRARAGCLDCKITDFGLGRDVGDDGAKACPNFIPNARLCDFFCHGRKRGCAARALCVCIRAAVVRAGLEREAALACVRMPLVPAQPPTLMVLNILIQCTVPVA